MAGPVTRRDTLIGIAALLLVVLAAYGNIVFRGQSLVASANYHPFDNRFDHLRPGKTLPPAFLNWYDAGADWWQWEPAGQHFERAFRKGTLPLWDPGIAAGVDAHVNLTQGQYFPPYVLLLLAGNGPLARDAYTLALLLASGMLCFLLLRRHGFHVVSAVTMGAAFVLGGAMTFNVNSIVGQSLAVIPALLLATDWLLERPRWPRAAILALAVALAVLSSFLPVVISGLLLIPFQWIGFVAVRAGDPGSRPLRAADSGMKLAAGVVLGLALAAFVLVPVRAASKQDPAFGSWYSGLGLQHYGADVALTWVSPRITYDVAQGSRRSALFPLPYDWSPAFFYVGLIPLLLGALAWSDPRPGVRRLRVFFAVAGAFLFLKLMGLPPVQWIGHLPVLNQIHFIPYFCGALGLCVAGLAALGIEGLVRARPPARARLAAAGTALTIFGLVFLFWSTHAANPAADRQPARVEIVRLAVLAGALLLVIVLRSRDRLSGPLAGALGLALVCLELAPLTFRPRFLRHDVWKDTPEFVRVLQADPTLFRIHSIGDLALTANVFQGLGLSGISSRHAFNPTRYDAFLREYFVVGESHFPVAQSLFPTRRAVLDLLGVKYLITFQGTEAQAQLLRDEGLELSHRDGDFALWRNPAAWQRAYVTNQYVRASTEAEALRAVGELTGPTRVVLEEAPPTGSEAGGTGDASCEITLYEPDLVRIHARSATPAILVLTDSFAPGWRARVNGKPERIVTANHAFRGVAIPAGDSVVEMRYRPPGMEPGLAVSGGAALAVLAMLGVGLFRARSGAGGGIRAD